MLSLLCKTRVCRLCLTIVHFIERIILIGMHIMRMEMPSMRDIVHTTVRILYRIMHIYANTSRLTSYKHNLKIVKIIDIV